MQEQLLHFIWHRRLFNTSGLVTTQGHQVEIVSTGTPNQDQGPDFLFAKIRIDDQLWAGHVEIHIRSSSWYLHGHTSDPHYDNVITHVVWQEDEPVITSSGYRLPCIELAPIVDASFLDRFRYLMQSEEWVPCASSLPDVSKIIRISWLERMMSERLETKTRYIEKVFQRCGADWEQAFFVLLARQLGAPANGDPMENLALKVNLNIMRRMNDRPDQIEAVLFGVAGMLTKELNVSYPLKLKSEFDFLRLKYGFQPLPALQWKFLRMRPAHFPTVRIAQLAALIVKFRHFIPLLTERISGQEFIRMFRVKPFDEYWNEHYHFKATTTASVKYVGKDTATHMVINLIAPFMFYYGQMQGMPELKERAINLLSELPAEKNSITAGWKSVQWCAAHAGQSQGMLHLKKKYCEEKKCLHCAIGLQVLKSGMT